MRDFERRWGGIRNDLWTVYKWADMANTLQLREVVEVDRRAGTATPWDIKQRPRRQVCRLGDCPNPKLVGEMLFWPTKTLSDVDIAPQKLLNLAKPALVANRYMVTLGATAIAIIARAFSGN